jgi:hypothetical protein
MMKRSVFLTEGIFGLEETGDILVPKALMGVVAIAD